MFIQHTYSLEEALKRGGVYQEKGVFTKKEIITKTLERLAPLLRTEPEPLIECFLEREHLMSTGLNKGVAVPHSRQYFQKGGEDVIALVHLDTPIAWGALDKRPVHTLFFLFAISDKHHLQLLARIAHLALSQEFHELIASTQVSDEVIFNYVSRWEQTQRKLAT